LLMDQKGERTLVNVGQGGNIIFRVNNSDKITMDQNGSFGIGTTSPLDKLDVHGPVRVSGSSNYTRLYTTSDRFILHIQRSRNGSNRKASWDGDTNWDYESDVKLKTNIVKENNILPRLMQLDVKNYNWKDGFNKHRPKSIGMVAQDVKPLFPALVNEYVDEHTKEPTLTLKYGSFGVLAVGAIKELKQEYDNKLAELQEEIAELKKENN